MARTKVETPKRGRPPKTEAKPMMKRGAGKPKGGKKSCSK